MTHHGTVSAHGASETADRHAVGCVPTAVEAADDCCYYLGHSVVGAAEAGRRRESRPSETVWDRFELK